MKMNENTQPNEPESFIVQNVTLGPHFVSDIRLNFGPLQAIDLTWEDPKIVKASKDLRASLRTGLLRKISPEQFENIENNQAIREKKELLKQKNTQNYQNVEVDGIEFQADSIDANKAYNPDGTISTRGYANDSLSYALALDIAQTQAQLQGNELTVETFADQVKNDASLVGRLIEMQKNMQANSSLSGIETKGTAYVVMPGDAVRGSSVEKVNLTNFNRVENTNNGYVAPESYDDTPIAEAIDLEAMDVDGDGEKGSIRRV
jgi:hypothetical protein